LHLVKSFLVDLHPVHVSADEPRPNTFGTGPDRRNPRLAGFQGAYLPISCTRWKNGPDREGLRLGRWSIRASDARRVSDDAGRPASGDGTAVAFGDGTAVARNGRPDLRGSVAGVITIGGAA
jgi:hypothetical protein